METTLNNDPRIAFFDHHAPHWDSYGPPAENTFTRLDELQEGIGLCPGNDVLEVGCGTGQVTPWLVKTVAPGKVTAVDFSPRMIDLAKARGTNARFVCADICRDCLGQDRYDAIFCIHVVPHFSDPAQALWRLALLLKPGGRLIILHLMGRNRVNSIHKDAGGPVAHDHLVDMGTWEKLMKDAPLSILHSEDREDLFLIIARS